MSMGRVPVSWLSAAWVLGEKQPPWPDTSGDIEGVVMLLSRPFSDGRS